jgi:hypothetical protein
VIAELMGAPLSDAPRLHHWSNWIQRQFDAGSLIAERTLIEAAVAEFYVYEDALIADRRRRPGEHHRRRGRAPRRHLPRELDRARVPPGTPTGRTPSPRASTSPPTAATVGCSRSAPGSTTALAPTSRAPSCRRHSSSCPSAWSASN